MSSSKNHMSLTLCLGCFGGLLLLWGTVGWAEQFSIVVLPDTQMYAAAVDDPVTPVDEAVENIFKKQTDWIRENKETEKIIYVAHLGDIVDSNCNAGDTEWGRADTAMDTLDNSPLIPYGVLPGNHDWDGPTSPPGCERSTRTNYNDGFPTVSPPVDGFGPGRYADVVFDPANPTTTYYGGGSGTPAQFDSTNNDNNYTLFQASANLQFIAINLAFSEETGPTEDDILVWADGLLKTFPDRRAIITSHFIQPSGAPSGDCAGTSDLGEYGRKIWDELSDNPNLFMMLSGHCFGEAWLQIRGGTSPTGPSEMPDEEPVRTRSSCMGDVFGLMSNYQLIEDRLDAGYLRIMRFNTDVLRHTIEIQTLRPPDIPGTDPVEINDVRSTPGTIPTMGTNSVSSFIIADYTLGSILRPSMVFLPDTSGSMATDFNGTTTRIEQAKQAGEAFLNLMFEAPGDTNAAGLFNLGVATFPDHPSTGGSAQAVMSPQTNTEENTDAAIGAINMLPTGGATPLLAGLSTANGMFGDQTCKAIVLLSDGYHNDPSVVSSAMDSEYTSVRSQLLATDTKVFAVAFGDPSEVPFDILNNLATDTGGRFADATDEEFDLEGAYKTFLQDLTGLEIGMDPVTQIGPGETQSFPIQVVEHDRKVTFYVSWATPQPRLLTFRVFDSNGNEIPAPNVEFPQGVKIVNGTSYRIMTVASEALRVPGRIGSEPWRLEVISNSQRPNEAESFQYSVLMDSGLKMQAGITGTGHVVGDRLTLTTELREGRRPILGLTEVTVTVTAPEDGRGNWLSINDVTAQQLAQIPVQQGDETFAPVVRKGRYLTDIAKVPFPSQKGPQVVRLFDDGTHGDVAAYDGTYTNRFANTRKEGTYSFYFQAKGPTQNGNFFTRERQVQTYLSVKPTSKTIEMEAVRVVGADDQRFDVVVTPKDPYGNFLGPGHLGLVTVVADGGTPMGVLRDNLNGSYTQTIVVPPGTDPQDVPVTATVREAQKTKSLAELLDGANFAVSLHAGLVHPYGALNTIADVGPTVTLDFLYRFTAHWGVDLRLGFSNFDGSAGHSDTNLYTVGTNLKYTLNPTSPVRIFLNGGGGLYVFDPGDVEAGVNIGLGLNIPINRRFSFEATYNYHNALTASETLHFDQFQLGVLASF